MDEDAPARQVPVVQGQREEPAVHQVEVRRVQALRRVGPEGMEHLMCEPKSRVRVLPVLGAVAVIAVSALAASVASAAAEAFAIAVLAVCVLGSVVTVRFIARSRAGFGVVVPDRCAPRVLAELMPARRALEASPLAIGGKPVLTGTVLAREREAVR